MTPEGRVKKKVKNILDELGAYYTMPVTGGYGNSGAPDFIICLAGWFYGIECKANGGKATALQMKHHDDIRKAGGIALIVDENNVVNLRKELLSYVQSKANSDPSQQGKDNQGSGEGHKVKRSVRVLRALD